MDVADSSKFSWLVLPVIGIFTLSLFYYFKPRAKLNVKGKYVLITGCDSGFGRLTAIALDKMGVCVLATCLTEEGEQSLKSVTSNKLKTFQLDVTNSEQIKEVYDKVKYLVESETGERETQCQSVHTTTWLRHTITAQIVWKLISSRNLNIKPLLKVSFRKLSWKMYPRNHVP